MESEDGWRNEFEKRMKPFFVETFPLRATSRLRREVVFIGITGAGKSNLCNLVSQNYNFRVGSKVQSTTSEVQTAEVLVNDRGKEYSICLYDTPGYFDSSGDNKKVQVELLALFKFGIPFISRIFIVLPHERSSIPKNVETLNYYLSIIKSNIIPRVVTVIFTKVPETGRQDIIDSYKIDANLQNTFKKYQLPFSSLMFVDLDPKNFSDLHQSKQVSKEMTDIYNVIFSSVAVLSPLIVFPVLEKTDLLTNESLFSRLHSAIGLGTFGGYIERALSSFLKPYPLEQ